uniref:Putative isoprenylcysteine alpha-carbonyl methylesterase ICMEL1 n=1 Tax=Rhizophora mucronata TaxID=61149 RepID=A0A2P2J443_RHIMU
MLSIVMLCWKETLAWRPLNYTYGCPIVNVFFPGVIMSNTVESLQSHTGIALPLFPWFLFSP